MNLIFFCSAIVFFISTSCQTSPLKGTTFVPKNLHPSIASSITELSDHTDLPKFSRNDSIASKDNFSLINKNTKKSFLLENKYVRKWIRYFTIKDRERLIRFLNRGQQYKEIVQNTLNENDLPEELFYLAMIESGYQNHARSPAQAVGVWQFISGTALRYGLKIDHYVDERKDPIRSTEAAAKYLRDLYNIFGSWHLAMAAYNAGEMRILRAILKAKTRNFWELVAAEALPRETAEYVPKFIAMALIAKNPEKYSLEINENILRYPTLQAVEVPGSFSLANLAKISNIDLRLLIKVNPHLSQYRTPDNTEKYEVWIPVELADRVQKSYTNLKNQNEKIKFVPATSTKFYTIKKSDTLLKIAQRHKVSLGHLKRINHLKSDKIYVGMKLRTFISVYIAPLKFTIYKVKKNDNLVTIAKKFKTTVNIIKRKNKLSRSTIFSGQILKIK